MSSAGGKKTEFGKFMAKWFTWDSWMNAGNGMADYGISRGLVLCVVFIGLLSILYQMVPNLPLFATGWLLGTAPIWLPVVCFIGALKAWTNYVRSWFLSRQKSVLLEIKIPREITQSPRAMELVFNSLYITSGEVTFIVRAWRGGMRPWFSFEIASFGGEIHFYVWCFKGYEHLVQASIYAQYPEVEIYEVEDYASKFEFDHDVHDGFVTEYWYTQGDSSETMNDILQIKTYVDFELDKDPKEEHKVEPLAQVFEFLSSLKPTEQVWIQMIMRQDGKRGGVFKPYSSDWKKRAAAYVEKIREQASVIPGADADPAAKTRAGFPHPTWKQTEQIRSIERHLGKLQLEVGMRGIMIVNGKLHGPTSTGYRWIWKPFNNTGYLNQLRPRHGHNPFDYPWQDYNNHRWEHEIHRYLDGYRRRSVFHPPFPQRTQVMTSESLASIYHFPSSVIKSPGLQRIASKKTEPPPNLPK